MLGTCTGKTCSSNWVIFAITAAPLAAAPLAAASAAARAAALAAPSEPSDAAPPAVTTCASASTPVAAVVAFGLETCSDLKSSTLIANITQLLEHVLPVQVPSISEGKITSRQKVKFTVQRSLGVAAVPSWTLEDGYQQACSLWAQAGCSASIQLSPKTLLYPKTLLSPKHYFPLKHYFTLKHYFPLEHYFPLNTTLT